MSGVLTVVAPSGRLFQSLMMAGKKDVSVGTGVTLDLCEMSGVRSPLYGRGMDQFEAVSHDFVIQKGSCRAGILSLPLFSNIRGKATCAYLAFS